MSKIIYRENDPSSLKLIVTNNLLESKFPISLEEKSEKTSVSPCLIIDPDHEIFCPNAAIFYLLPPPKKYIPEINQLLEVDSNILSPSLACLIGSGLKCEKTKKLLISNLEKIDHILSANIFVVGDKISVADIAIFSTLYPLFKSIKHFKEYLIHLSNIVLWLKSFEVTIAVKDALSIVFKNNLPVGQSAYQVLFQNSQYFLPEISEQMANLEQPETGGVTEEEMESAEKSWNIDIKTLPKLKPREKVVLPKPGEKNVLITSALPYVNNVPHLGNIIGCVLSADVFARYSRLCNANTLFVCGTDEYGTATETKALEEGLSCQAICDKYYKIHSEIYKWFNISFDHFGRTSCPEQSELAQSLFLQLNHNGFTFTQSVEQLHCGKCNRYLADRFVEGGCPNIGCNYEDARGDQCDGCGKLVNAVELKNPRCKICGESPKIKSSRQFFIDLPKLEPLIRVWIKTSCPGWSHNADVIAKSWLKEGLKPRCITRDLKWGVPVPLDGYRNKVFYVWFDAPIGYISISKAYTAAYEKWWTPDHNVEVKLYQFMAKDNVPFHAILFPAMLLGAHKNYITVSHIMATEYLNYEDGKFSKSRGVGVFGNDARDTGIPNDVWRFYLLYVRPESQDSSFSWSDLVTKNNSELLNNLGNFVNRALVFTKNSFNSVIPKMEMKRDDYFLLALCTKELQGYINSLEKGKLRDGIRHILAISKFGNQYMQAHQPWTQLKGSAVEKTRAGTVVGVCCNVAALLATLLEPYMPETSNRLKKQLNFHSIALDPNNVIIVNLLPAGHKIGDPFPLFVKIDVARAEELKKKFAGKQDVRNSAQIGNNLKTNGCVDELQNQVTKQADKVRKLKATGVAKAQWQPEVDVLLQLKDQLAQVLKLNDGNAPPKDLKNGLANGNKSKENKPKEKKVKEKKVKAGKEKQPTSTSVSSPNT